MLFYRALLRKHFDEQILAVLGPRDAEVNKTVKPKQTKAPKADVSPVTQAKSMIS